MKRLSIVTASLDMLLDTMCNTFGGVCFIALLIAIISYSLPRTDAEDADASSGVSAQMLVDRERERLTRTRDELRVAIQVQEALQATNAAQRSLSKSEAEYVAGIASNAQTVAKLRREREMLEDELAKLSTQSEYSRKEAERLDRLLKDMEERLDKPQNLRNRPVRTPLEREIEGLHIVNLWLRHGRFYVWDWWNTPPRHVKVVEYNDGNGAKNWIVTPIQGAGLEVGEALFKSEKWREIMNQLDSKGYARIFSDEDSFPQLCELRDALIRHGKMYNWHIRNEDELRFVEGYDGRIQ